MDCPGSDWSKRVSIATDGAHAICSKKVGPAGLLKNKLKENNDIFMSAIHCIMHQEALCGKRLKEQVVMNYVVKTVNLFAQEVQTTDRSLLTFPAWKVISVNCFATQKSVGSVVSIG